MFVKLIKTVTVCLTRIVILSPEIKQLSEELCLYKAKTRKASKRVGEIKNLIMFKAPFSFKGRIGMLEYFISVLIYIVYLLLIKNYLIDYLFQSFEDVRTVFLVLSLSLIPAIYFALAQGAKRNHDIGNSGWFILLPLNNFIILFIPSEKADNKYGEYLD